MGVGVGVKVGRKDDCGLTVLDKVGVGVAEFVGVGVTVESLTGTIIASTPYGLFPPKTLEKIIERELNVFGTVTRVGVVVTEYVVGVPSIVTVRSAVSPVVDKAAVNDADVDDGVPIYCSPISLVGFVEEINS
jgi:hypothetical protein